jgi:hypothetical protein
VKIDEVVATLTRHIEHTGSVLAEDTHYVVAVVAEIARLRAVGELRQRLINGFPFCPDHRDKQHGKPCLACEVDRLRVAYETSHACRLHAEREIERLRQHMKINEQKIESQTDEIERLRAALKDMDSKHMPRSLYPNCACKGCKVLRGE